MSKVKKNTIILILFSLILLSFIGRDKKRTYDLGQPMKWQNGKHLIVKEVYPADDCRTIAPGMFIVDNWGNFHSEGMTVNGKKCKFYK